MITQSRMDCIGSASTKLFVGEAEDVKMAGAKGAVSRRAARVFTGEPGGMEPANTSQRSTESRYTSGDEKNIDRPPREGTSSSGNVSVHGGTIPMVDLGTDLFGLFPTPMDDREKQVTKSLQASKASAKSKGGGRPVNFGVVLPYAIYRSSFPMIEDFQFLGSLGLKTIVSLVKTEFSPDFKAFMKVNGIRHCVIDMQGTKVAIPDAIMNSTMEVTLNKENHPLLIHCNHGKHRTGCAVAVIRHAFGWNVTSILEEYKGHANPKVRDCDLKYITDYEGSTIEDILVRHRIESDKPVPSEAKMVRMFLIAVIIILTILFTFAFFWGRL